MRILEISRQFYPSVGGVESCVLNVSRGLLDRGHHVEVVTLNRNLRTGQPYSVEFSANGIPVHRIPYFGSTRYPIAPRVLKYVSGFDILHVHCIDFFNDFLAVTAALHLHDRPYIVTTHGGIFHTKKWTAMKRLYWRTVLPVSLGRAAHVVCVSEADRALIGSAVAAEKLSTIPNGVDDAFARAHATRRRGAMVYVGRLSKGKAIDNVIRLFARLASDAPYATLTIVGPDEEGTASHLTEIITESGLDGRVKILAPLPVTELAALVASAHLYISASPHEGFGIATVEALSAGVPAFVTPTGVHAQVVRENETGWLWDGRSSAEAADKLHRALRLSDEELDHMQTNARTAAGQYQWHYSIDRYEAVLQAANRTDKC